MTSLSDNIGRGDTLAMSPPPKWKARAPTDGAGRTRPS